MPPAGHLPDRDFQPQPWWWDACPPSAPAPQPLPRHAEVAVVGGGIAGLSVAYELARRGAQVTVLEADADGYNASARNSGGVSFALDLGKVRRWRRWFGRGGPDLPALAQAARASFDHTERFIAEHGIACDYHRRGRLSCAPTPRHYEVLAQRVDAQNRLFDAQARMLTKVQQYEEIGSERFHGTMVIERSGQLDPARYVQGLVALCQDVGVALHAHTPVTRVERTANGHDLHVGNQRLRTGTLVVAVNAQALRLPGTALARHIVPVASNIIVTQPLREDIAGALLPRRRTGADNRHMLAYFRLLPDGRRFLYGSRASPFDTSSAHAAAVLYRRMVDSFPQLDGVRLTHAWGCQVAFTLDAVPHIGEQDGLHFVAGCNGNGVAMMGYLGHQLALKIAGGSRTDCVFDLPGFPSLPLYRGRPWFLPAVALGYKALDTLDELRAPRQEGR